MKVELSYITSSTFDETEILHKELCGIDIIAETDEERKILQRLDEEKIKERYNPFESTLHLFFGDMNIRYYM